MNYNIIEIINSLNEQIIDDILNGNLQVMEGLGVADENYVFGIIADHLGTYDKKLINKIFDEIEEILQLKYNTED